MARIPDEQVARLKTEVSIVRLVEATGIELEKHGGSDLVGRCPFHDGRTPSLVVSPDKNLWHCLGACGVGGSVIDFYHQTLLESPEALEYLDKRGLTSSDDPRLRSAFRLTSGWKYAPRSGSFVIGQDC